MRKYLAAVSLALFAVSLTATAWAEDLPPLPEVPTGPAPALPGADTAAATPAATTPAATAPGVGDTPGAEASALPDVPDVPDVPDLPGTTDTTGADEHGGEEHTTTTETPAGASSGKIHGGRVNIRSGPGSRYEIVVTLNEGTPVNIFAQKDGWLQIDYPQSSQCYISQHALTGQIPAEIPQGGLSMSVSQDAAAVHVRQWEQSTEVCRLNKGDAVTVFGVRGDWARISPPANARAWIFSQFVQTGSDTAAAPTVQDNEVPPAPPETGAGSTTADGKKIDPVAERVRKKVEAAAEAEQARRDAEDRAAEEERKQQIAEINRKLQEIENEARIDSAEEPVGPPPAERLSSVGGLTGGVSGWVEYIGMVGRRPAAFRLVKGGEIVYLLRSSKYDLSKFVNSMVYVNGQVELAPGFEANVLIVDNLEKLGDPPASLRDQKVEIRFPYREKPKPMQTPEETAQPEAGSDAPAAGDDTAIGSEPLESVTPAPAAEPTAMPADNDADADTTVVPTAAAEEAKVIPAPAKKADETVTPPAPEVEN